MLRHLFILSIICTFCTKGFCQIWNHVGNGVNDKVYSFITFNNELYIGGAFTNTGNDPLNHVGKWDGTQWSSLGTGLNGNVYTLGNFNGDLIAGGEFTSSGSSSLNHIAKWNGTEWVQLGAGLNGTVYSIIEYEGSLYAGGSFSLSDDIEVKNIAKWDGSYWNPVSIGVEDTIKILKVIDGELYAGGNFLATDGNIVNHIAKWDGAYWYSLGNGFNGNIYDIAKFNDELYAVGSFTQAEDSVSNYIARWDGISWSTTGIGANDIITGLAVHNSMLYVIGQFTSINEIAANGIAKWDGNIWQSEGNGFTGGYPCCLKTFNDELYIGGDFTEINNVLSPFITKLDPCPNLGPNRSKTIICSGDVTNISGLYDLQGLSAQWNLPDPTIAPLGIHKLIVTNNYGCKDSALITVKPNIETWIGTNSENWHDSLNWSNNSIPNDSTHVIISTPTPFPCKVSTDDATVASLRLENNSTLDVLNNHKLNITANCDTVPSVMELWPNVVLIDSSSSDLIELVDSSKVIFNGTSNLLQNLAVNNIIVSGIAPNAPYGFMRKITDIQINGTIYTCTTIEVPLTDVFKELHINYTKSFSNTDTLQNFTTSLLSFNVQMPDIILYDHDGNNSTTIDQLKVSGNLELIPDFHFAIDIDPFPVRLNYAKIECGFESSLTMSVTAGGSIGNMPSKKINIFNQPLAIIEIPAGPIPIVIVPNLRVSLGADASINVGINATQTTDFNVTGFIEYQNNNWDKGYTKTMQNQFNFSGINGTASAKVYVEPAVDFKLYNSDWAKGSIFAQGYLKAKGEIFPSQTCELKAGISAGAEANLEFFGWTLTAASYPQIFDYSTLLYTCSFNNKPTVSTSAATNVGINAVTLGGNVSNSGGLPVTSRGLCWSSTNLSPTLSDNVETIGSGMGTFSENLSGLSANTLYRVRAFATNSQGTSYGNVVSFTTHQPASLPVLTTKPVTSITQTGAISGGIITSPGNTPVTARGICWSTLQNPTIANNTIQQGSGTGSFMCSLIGLTQNTTYYIRAYAINSQGISYGNQLGFSTPSGTGGTWVQKADLGSLGRSRSVSFSIGSKGYMGTGWSDPNLFCTGNPFKDFWEYNPSSDTWTQKANYGGQATGAAVGFSIGSKGYIGTAGCGSIDFWEYNPSNNAWTKKADFPGDYRYEAVGFSIGNKGYVCTGYKAAGGGFLQDLWEYNPSTDTWIQKANFPGSPRSLAVGFSIGNKGYVGTGLINGSPATYINDFWEYDPSTNTWTQKTNFPGTSRYDATGFSIGTKGYVGSGFDGVSNATDFWEYDPSTNTWAQKTNVGGGFRAGAKGFSIGTKGYIGTGSSSTLRKDLWEYNP